MTLIVIKCSEGGLNNDAFNFGLDLVCYNRVRNKNEGDQHGNL
jgi:hypothetical protein